MKENKGQKKKKDDFDVASKILNFNKILRNIWVILLCFHELWILNVFFLLSTLCQGKSVVITNL